MHGRSSICSVNCMGACRSASGRRPSTASWKGQNVKLQAAIELSLRLREEQVKALVNRVESDMSSLRLTHVALVEFIEAKVQFKRFKMQKAMEEISNA